ncbi:hypothetical protein K7X08_025772 [Anisodus acutangulus]|uniref:Uncharacterized protein n=1 Tax=Anisodus acutangulus TaxID=402998 RepID=A0A9Q1QXG1_9SOLA|nr:hypothetical protein K7X08_025772 [Anisodus acutangulus]
MAIQKVSYLALLLLFGIILLVSNVKHADAEACSKKCDDNLYYEICPGIIRPTCINCCEGKLGCQYYNGSGDLVCYGFKKDEVKGEDDQLEGCIDSDEDGTFVCDVEDDVQIFKRWLFPNK